MSRALRVAILDDWFDTLRTLPSFQKLAGHDVTVFTDHVQDDDTLAERLLDVEALVLIRERTEIRAPLLQRLPSLRLISQRSVYRTSTSRPAPASGSWCPPTCTRARRHTPRPS
jgi:D-3-phosphoglycerate dehydrogenase